jgi:hypothetical protein
MPFSRVPVAFRSRPATRVLVYALVVMVAAAVGALAASCARTIALRDSAAPTLPSVAAAAR